MKKLILLSVLMGAMPLTMLAQDDMYFVPKKKSAVEAEKVEKPAPVYYSGSNRDVDEYNRRGGSYVQQIDSLGNDIIDFSAEQGVYPDSLEVEDFKYTKRMSRFDDYDAEAYWEGYYDGSRQWYWHSPWYYRTYGWYGGWYSPWAYGHYWYDPWFYSYSGWYGGPWSYWYDPWYYDSFAYGYGPLWGWYGWRHYYPNAGGGHVAYRHSSRAYSAPRGTFNGRSTRYSAGTFGGSRTGSFGGTRNSTTRSTGTSDRVYRNTNGNFGGSRSSATSGGTRSYSSGSSSGSFGGGGSFGGSRSSGGGGGSRSSGGGGGHFGGRR